MRRFGVMKMRSTSKGCVKLVLEDQDWLVATGVRRRRGGTKGGGKLINMLFGIIASS